MSPLASDSDHDPSGPRPPGLLEIGRATKAHGLRGEIVVKLTTNRTERVHAGSTLFAAHERLEVVSSRAKGKDHLVTFRGRESRESVESLQGQTLWAEPLDDVDELWVHELIGSTVVDQTGVERGPVVSVEANPASDLLVLENGALVPMRFIEEIRGEVIEVDVPDGLFDL